MIRFDGYYVTDGTPRWRELVNMSILLLLILD